MQYGLWNFIIDSSGDAPLSTIENSRTEYSASTAMEIKENALHLVDLDNVSFANNDRNHIDISDETGDSLVSLANNIILFSQPGLEGYEIGYFNSSSHVHLHIPLGVTFTLTPDVMLFSRDSIIVDGRLDAVGTHSQPITFTSVENVSPGEWGGISIGGTGSAHLNHAIVQNGEFNIGISSQADAPVSIIENTVTQSSQDIGMFINDYSRHLVDLDNVTFRDNGRNRVLIEGAGVPITLADDVTLITQVATLTDK